MLEGLIGVIASIFTAILSAILTYHFSIKTIDYEKSLEILENTKSPEDLLFEAEKFYKMGEVNKTYEIYNLNALLTNPIALSNLAYLYENGIFVQQNISKAKELYKKAHKLGNIKALDNWVRFIIKYPESMIPFIGIMEEAHNMGSIVPKQFISGYIDEKSIDNKFIHQFFGLLNSDQIKSILFQRVYEEEIECTLEDKLSDLIGREFIINAHVETKEEHEFMGTYEKIVKVTDENWLVKEYKHGQPLYGTRHISRLYYKRYSFMFSHVNPTEFIFMQ